MIVIPHLNHKSKTWQNQSPSTYDYNCISSPVYSKCFKIKVKLILLNVCSLKSQHKLWSYFSSMLLSCTGEETMDGATITTTHRKAFHAKSDTSVHKARLKSLAVNDNSLCNFLTNLIPSSLHYIELFSPRSETMTYTILLSSSLSAGVTDSSQ